MSRHVQIMHGTTFFLFVLVMPTLGPSKPARNSTLTQTFGSSRLACAVLRAPRSCVVGCYCESGCHGPAEYGGSIAHV